MDVFAFIPPSIDLIVPASGGCGNIYLGNISSAYEETLSQLNITTVISVIKLPGKEFKEGKPSIKNHLHIKADDFHFFDLSQYFQEVFVFMEKHRETNILIHCFAGVSRSATILISYLMKKNNWEYNFAFQNVQSIRKYISPNDGFKKQLLQWYKCNFQINYDTDTV